MSLACKDYLSIIKKYENQLWRGIFRRALEGYLKIAKQGERNSKKPYKQTKQLYFVDFETTVRKHRNWKAKCKEYYPTYYKRRLQNTIKRLNGGEVGLLHDRYLLPITPQVIQSLNKEFMYSMMNLGLLDPVIEATEIFNIPWKDHNFLSLGAAHSATLLKQVYERIYSRKDMGEKQVLAHLPHAVIVACQENRTEQLMFLFDVVCPNQHKKHFLNTQNQSLNVFSLLQWAVMHGNDESVQYLITIGAQVNQKSIVYGSTALTSANTLGKFSALMKANADPNMIYPDPVYCYATDVLDCLMRKGYGTAAPIVDAYRDVFEKLAKKRDHRMHHYVTLFPYTEENFEIFLQGIILLLDLGCPGDLRYRFKFESSTIGYYSVAKRIFNQFVHRPNAFNHIARVFAEFFNRGYNNILASDLEGLPAHIKDWINNKCKKHYS
jgi:hypothetical protein